MPALKIGDHVVCVRGPGTGQLIAGRIYKVRETLGAGRSQLVSLDVWPGMMWSAGRFEVVDCEFEAKKQLSNPESQE